MKLHARLAALAFRRTLTPGVLGAACVLFLLLACRDWAPPYALLDAEAGGRSAERSAEELARAFTRQGMWSGVCACAIPFLLLRAARAGRRSAREDREWIASRAIEPASVFASSWIGLAAASVVLVCVAALAIEALLPESGPSSRLHGTVPLAEIGWIDASKPARFTLGDPAQSLPEGSRLAIEVGLGSGGGATSELAVRTRGAHENSASEWDFEAHRRIASRGTIEVEVPPGGGPIEIEIACVDPEARFLVLSRQAEIWTPAASERAASTTLALSLSLAFAAWTALCFGLGTLMRPWIATGLALALWIPVWSGESAPRWMPGGELLRALDVTGRGRVAPELSLASFVAALAIAVFGGVLARAGAERARRQS